MRLVRSKWDVTIQGNGIETGKEISNTDMLDLFSIFTKGGIVLWCFQGTGLSLTPAVNALIKTVILQVGLFVLNHSSLYLWLNLIILLFFIRKGHVLSSIMGT